MLKVMFYDGFLSLNRASFGCLSTNYENQMFLPGHKNKTACIMAVLLFTFFFVACFA